MSASGLAKSFRKFFKIQVLNPLNVKTNFYNAEVSDIKVLYYFSTNLFDIEFIG
jgi:Protein of unknown function (DUF974)